METEQIKLIIIIVQNWIIWGLLFLNILWIKQHKNKMKLQKIPMGNWPYIKGILMGVIAGPFGLVLGDIVEKFKLTHKKASAN